MLTKDQTSLIENITAKFNELNSSETSDVSSLFDVNSIIEKQDAKEKLNEERKLNDILFQESLESHVSEWTVKLNELFHSLGFEVTKHKGINIRITSKDVRICHTEEIDIYGGFTYDKNNFRNGFEFRFYYTPNHDEKQPSFEKLLASNNFKTRIERLYDKVRRITSK